MLASSGDVYNDNSTKEGFSNMVDTKELNSVKVVIGLNDQETEAVQVLEDLIQPIRPGLEFFHAKSYFICIVEKVEQSSLKRNEAMEYYFPVVPFQFYEREDGIHSIGALISLGIIIGKMLMFTFDPGGISWSIDIHDSLLFTDDKQCFDKSCGLAGSVLAFFINGKAMLIVLSSWCIGRNSGTVVEVVYFGKFLLSFTTYEYLAKAFVIWNFLVHIWRDIVVVFSKVKMVKTQYESTVSGHCLKASRSLIECCNETNLRLLH